MKHLIAYLLLVTALGTATASAQDYARSKNPKGEYTRQFTDKTLKKAARKWFTSGVWKNGFTKGVPHHSVNVTEFYDQYQKNPEAWQAVFRWLESTDLRSIQKGKYTIPGTEMTVSVEDSSNEPVEKRKSESHFHNVDFMFIVDGIEGFLRLDHKTSVVSTKYKYDVVRYDYDINRAEYLESGSGCFLLMFPDDWHVAKVMTPHDSQNIRVVVIKVPYMP